MSESIYGQDIIDGLSTCFKDGHIRTRSQYCAHLGISRQTLYEWQDKHPAFKRAWNVAMEQLQSYHESQLLAGADGELEGCSAPMRIFFMKNVFREDYAEQKEENPMTPVIQAVLGLVADKAAK